MPSAPAHLHPSRNTPAWQLFLGGVYAHCPQAVFHGTILGNQQASSREGTMPQGAHFTWQPGRVAVGPLWCCLLLLPQK